MSFWTFEFNVIVKRLACSEERNYASSLLWFSCYTSTHTSSFFVVFQIRRRKRTWREDRKLFCLWLILQAYRYSVTSLEKRTRRQISKTKAQKKKIKRSNAGLRINISWKNYIFFASPCPSFGQIKFQIRDKIGVALEGEVKIMPILMKNADFP